MGEYLQLLGTIYLLFLARYLVGTTIPFLAFSKGSWAQKFKIQKPEFKSKDIWFEIRNSLVANLVYALILAGIFHSSVRPHTKIYNDIDEHGIVWFAFSVLLLAVIHDSWTYWQHKTFHDVPWLYKKFHSVHHRSHNPTAFAIASLHPLEAVVEIFWVTITVMAIPICLWALVAYSFIELLVSGIGHYGYEFLPPKDKNNFLKWFSSASHHNFHHRYAGRRCNYQPYFTYWDRLMGTYWTKASPAQLDLGPSHIRSISPSSVEENCRKVVGGKN